MPQLQKMGVCSSNTQVHDKSDRPKSEYCYNSNISDNTYHTFENKNDNSEERTIIFTKRNNCIKVKNTKKNNSTLT